MVVDKCTSEVANNADSVSVDSGNVKLHDMFENSVYVVTPETEVNKVDDDWIVTLSVHGRKFGAEIDTGAKCNILSLLTLRDLNVPHKINNKETILITGVHGASERSLGSVVLPCIYNGVKSSIKFNVMDGKTP